MSITEIAPSTWLSAAPYGFLMAVILAGAGRDEECADILPARAVLFGELSLGRGRGRFHRREQVNDVIDQIGEAHLNEPYHGGAGRRDHGQGFFSSRCARAMHS